jgi:hypothetical protein
VLRCPGAGRFDLSVRLLDKASKAAAAELCSQLQKVLPPQDVQQRQQQGIASHCTFNSTDHSLNSRKGSSGNAQQVDTSGSGVGEAAAIGDCNSQRVNGGSSSDSAAAALADLQAVMANLEFKLQL